MKTTLLRMKIAEAKVRLETAEQELSLEMQRMTDESGGETTLIAQLLEGAFSKFRDARSHLAVLNDLLDGGDGLQLLKKPA